MQANGFHVAAEGKAVGSGMHQPPAGRLQIVACRVEPAARPGGGAAFDLDRPTLAAGEFEH